MQAWRRVVNGALTAMLLGVLVPRAGAAPVAGKVVGPDGQPLADVQVFGRLRQNVVRARMQSMGGSHVSAAIMVPGLLSARTNRAGRFVFTAPLNLPPGGLSGDLAAYKAGFGLAHSRLAPGLNVLRLAAANTVRGQVKDARGAAVAGATVRLVLFAAPQAGESPRFRQVPQPLASRFTTKTDASGWWRLQDLPTSGQAIVELQDVRYLMRTMMVALSRNATAPVMIATAPAAITGRVVNETGQPLTGVKVTTAGPGGRYGYQRASARTSPDGTYRLAGLATGAVAVTAEDATRERVGAAVQHVRVISGHTTPGVNLRLTPGAIIAGVVTDKATRKALPGVLVFVAGAGEPVRVQARARSDAHGSYRVRVAPGSVRLRVDDPPAGFLPSVDDAALGVAEGQTKRLDLQLEHVLTLSGIIVDPGGHPAAHVRLMVQPDYRRRLGRNYAGPQMATSDAKGKWSTTGWQPGAVLLSIAGHGSDWEIDGPTEVSLPASQPVKVTVRRLSLLTLRGRVVTRTGMPLARVAVTARVRVARLLAENPYGGNVETRSARTDKTGTVTIPKLRGGSTIAVLAAAPGYHYLRGGAVILTGTGFVMSDLVLAPLNIQARGVVLNAAGKPVAGATVACLDGEESRETTTDAAGHFVLKQLADVPVTIMAAASRSLAQIEHADPKHSLVLHLKPVAPLPSADLQRGYTLLEKIFEAGPRGLDERDPQMYAVLKELWPGTNGGRFCHYIIPQSLVGVDPDLALRLVTQHGGLFPEAMVASIIMSLAARDPVRAAAWAPDKLGLLNDGFASYLAKTGLALAVVDIKPALARELYDQIKTRSVAPPGDEAGAAEGFYAAFRQGQLAALATRLHLPEAQSLTDAAVTGLKGLDPFIKAQVAGTLVAADPARATKLLAGLPARDRASTLGVALQQISPWDVKTLRQIIHLLGQNPANPDENGGVPYYYLDAALRRVVTAVGPTQPALALATVRQLAPAQVKAEILVMVAAYQPRATALRLLHEVAQSSSLTGNVSNMAWLLAQAYRLDPAWATKLFEQRRATLLEQRRRAENYGQYTGASEMAAFAYYYRCVDPAMSRLMLEEEFQRQLRFHQGREADYSTAQSLSDVPAAMAALDVDRALAMVAQLPVSAQGMRSRYFGTDARLQALSQIGEYLVQPATSRRSRPFKQWTERRGFFF